MTLPARDASSNDTLRFPDNDLACQVAPSLPLGDAHGCPRSSVSLLAALAIASSSLSACAAGATKRTTGEPANFEGVWTASQCDPRAPARECGVFTLYLTQDGARICGEHFVATTGLARLDEAEQGTVLGQATGSHAVIVINSTRNGVFYLADMQHTKDEISWRLVGPVTESKSGISPIIPAKLSLMKDSCEEQQKHLHSVRSAPCSWPSGLIVSLLLRSPNRRKHK